MTKGVPASGDARAGSAEGLIEAGWEMLTLGEAADGGGAPLDVGFVFAHPVFGIALVDLLRPRSPASVSRLHARLEAVGFSRQFPGHLPVIHRVLEVGELWQLSRALEAAFASQPPLGVAEGWIGLVRQALLLKARDEVPGVPRVALPSFLEAELRPLAEPAVPVEEPALAPEGSPQEEAVPVARTEEQVPVPLPVDGAAEPVPIPTEAEVQACPEEVPPEPAGDPVARMEEETLAPPPPVDVVAEPAALRTEPELFPAGPYRAGGLFAPPAGTATRMEERLAAPQEPIRPPGARPARRGFWFAVAAILLAAIGLSHHLILPDGWAARLHLIVEPSRPDPG